MNNNAKNIFILSGPSGAGEDSIVKKLEKLISIEKVITTTTRPMREDESQGKPYYFISKDEFKRGIGKNEFFEYVEEDNENLYGVTNKELDRIKKSDKVVIWRMEYKGAIKIKKLLPEVATIFIDVPVNVIRKRIMKRDRVAKEAITFRLKYAQGWYENRDSFDFIIKNENGKLDKAVKDVMAIIIKK